MASLLFVQYLNNRQQQQQQQSMALKARPAPSVEEMFGKVRKKPPGYRYYITPDDYRLYSRIVKDNDGQHRSKTEYANNTDFTGDSLVTEHGLGSYTFADGRTYRTPGVEVDEYGNSKTVGGWGGANVTATDIKQKPVYSSEITVTTSSSHTVPSTHGHQHSGGGWFCSLF